MKSFMHWLKLVFCLREPTPEENVLQLRAAAKKMRAYNLQTAERLEQMASDAEKGARS